MADQYLGDFEDANTGVKGTVVNRDGQPFLVSGNSARPLSEVSSNASSFFNKPSPAPASNPFLSALPFVPGTGTQVQTAPLDALPIPAGEGYAIPQQQTQSDDSGISNAGAALAPRLTERTTLTKGTDLGNAPAILNKGVAENAMGLQEQMAAGQAIAARNLGIQKQAMKEDAALQAENMQKERDRQTQLTSDLNDLDMSITNLKSQQLDPFRLYHNMGTGDKILAGIGLLLGGMAQTGKYGTKTNEVWDMFNTFIENDIQAQKQDFEKARDLVSAQATLYGKNMEKFRDDRSAEAAARAQLWASVGHQLDLSAAQSGSDIVQANYNIAKGLADQKVAQVKAEFAKERSDKLTIEQSTMPVSPIERNNAIKGLKEEVNNDEDLKAYGKAQRGMIEFQNYLKNGATGPALISFLTDEMNRGRFSDSLANEVKKGNGLPDYLQNEFHRVKGDLAKSPVLQKLLQGMKDTNAAYHVMYGPKINDLHQRAQALGVDPNAIFTTNANPISQGAAAAGDKPLR